MYGRFLLKKGKLSQSHSLARDTSEMPSSASVGQVLFLRVLWFSPTSD